MKARSSAKVKYKVVIQGVWESLWLSKLKEELKLLERNGLRLFYNNKRAINIVHNQVQHNRTQHIEINRYN